MSYKTDPLKRDPGSALSNMEALQSHFMEVTKGKQTVLKSKQTKRALVMTSESASKRFIRGQSTDMETHSLSRHTDLCPIQTADVCESDTGNDFVMEQEGMGTVSSYTCPLGESDLDSDDTTDSRSLGNQDHLENPKSCSLSSDILRESESSCPRTRAPFLITTDISSSSPPVHSNVNPFACQPEISDETGPQDMWKLRANRVKQILSEFGPFHWSERVSLEFNVGFGPKQNISVDSLLDFTLTEIARFALAMNSSQQYFIMEILEYNFDLHIKSESKRNIFIFEIMETVRQLKDSQGADKHPGDVFDSPHFLMECDQEVENASSVNPELSSVLGKEGSDVAPIHYLQSHAETKDHMSPTMLDSYPFCKEMGLKLHVNQCQQNKKLDLDKLTNGALTEVANFAEKLCGTFEEICLDLLRHNLDLDLQSGDSDLARNMLDRILLVMERKNLKTCAKAFNILKNKKKKSLVKLDCQTNQNSDACTIGSSQDATIDQSVGSSPEPVNQKELNSMLWKLRANHIQHILSVPHEEHCPLYTYSRCKKLGIDFNVGSGVKQNLDPKLLTNGIMVEICTFATELLTAHKYFITEILEYNFHLNFNNESHRSAFAQQTIVKMQAMIDCKDNPQRRQLLFELNESRCIQGPSQNKVTYCPKCYQERERKLHLKKTDPDGMHWPHSHTMSNEVSADTDCIAQKPAKDPTFTFTAIEEKVIDSYPLCKKIGLSLFVKNDQPKDKLDRSVLTLGIMVEIADFVRKLCATQSAIIHALLEHNFGVGMQRPDIDIAQLFGRALAQKDGGLAWFSEVFIFQPLCDRQPGHTSKLEDASAMQISERKKTIKKRKLPLQTKEEGPTLRSYSVSGVKSMRNAQSQGNSFPICSDIGLDLDMTSKTGEKEKLDLKLLTKDVCDMAQEEIGTESNNTCPLGVPFLITTDISSSSPPVNSNVNPFACQPEISDETGPQDMWKLRANRVKQILSEFGPFHWSERVNLEFNVGFGPKQNISVESLLDFTLIEIARFALAMNSSQQNFIMQILEYNFDLCFSRKLERHNFTCEIMETVRQLKGCQDTATSSKEIFDSPHLLMECDQEVQSTSCVNPELGSVSRKEECDVAPICHPQSHAETEKHRSPTIVNPYPFCKEIGLKLHVNQRQKKKKLDFNNLTNGALTEVANFAERLCGTFEEICLDLLRHNLDLDLQSGDSDLARNMLDRILLVMERKNLITCAKAFNKLKNKKKKSLVKLDCQTNQNSDACTIGSSQDATIDQSVGSSPEPVNQEELNSMLWKLRANHIQHILSVPHEEHCPLYTYSRCKKLGIDFNVGSGVKQNLDPKLLTNGIMVEICTFATELLTAHKYFITEILEYNFHLNFNNESHRSAFAQQTIVKMQAMIDCKDNPQRRQLLFELNESRCIQGPSQNKVTYCPKCYQERERKLHLKKTDPDGMHWPHSHTMSNEVSADTDCIAQKPAKDPTFTFTAIEEKVIDSYPLCKKIGLSLFVKNDQPKDKLDRSVLTLGIMVEIADFVRKLCATQSAIIHALLEHNFGVGMQRPDIDIAQLFGRALAQKDGGLAWFSEVFIFQPLCDRQPGHTSKLEDASAMQISERKKTIKKRKLPLQTKEEGPTLRSYSVSGVKSMRNAQSQGNSFPICSDIGLDLDMTSKTGEKEKLDLKLLTKDVCDMAQGEIGTESNNTCPLGVPFLITTDLSSCSPPVNSNVNPFASQPDKTQTPRNIPKKCDIKQEETGAQDMWKLRANRVEQILSEFGPFYGSEKVGLEFNVGFGPKQNISVDSLRRHALLEVAKFALAMNSSQQYFIMEILEYNFDLHIKSESKRNIFIFEIMETVRQLKDSQAADEHPGDVFDSPHFLMECDQEVENASSVNPELSSVLGKEGSDVAPIHYLQSHAETKDHMPPTMLDSYPFCKEMGLKLHVNQCQQNKKLDFDKLTNEALTEVANFAEKLCGTFKQICLDLLRHNLDLDLQSGDSDLAQGLFAQIPFAMERKNLNYFSKAFNYIKRKGRDDLTNVQLDCLNSPNLDACSAGSAQVATVHQNVDGSPVAEKQKELNSMLWKLRANHIQEILSIPHEKHCPLYSYSRCKKLGIDFNVGSGVKQNLDPKLLTNGIMVEMCLFAIELLLSQRYFITEILEYNFRLRFKNELHRSAFVQQTGDKIAVALRNKRCLTFRMNMPFVLPELRDIQESTRYCPRCYQVRNYRLHQNESDPGHMHHLRSHTMTDTVPADANCTAQKPALDPSSTIAAEETIMDHYPRCKKIGLSLCVNKDQPKDKLDKQVLTLGIMAEVDKFAKELCGTKNSIIHAVLEHNFNVGPQTFVLNIFRLFHRVREENIGELAWFNESFDSQLFSYPPISYGTMRTYENQSQPGHASKPVEASATRISERKETIKKRMLALQTKEKRPTLPSPNTGVVKSKTRQQNKKCYPHCTEIGLDLNVKSKSRKKNKLNLNLLTRAVVCEIHKFAVKNPGNYMPHTMFKILEYNFDLSSQHYRRWEFSIATTSKVQAMVKQRALNRNRPHEVFKLPFISAPKTNNEKPKKHSRKESDKKKRMGSNHSDSSDDDFLNAVETNWVAGSYEDTEFSVDPWSALPMCGSPVSEGCDSPLQGNMQIGEEEYDAHFGNMNPELDTETAVPTSGSLESEAGSSPLQGNIRIKEEKYDPRYGNVKQELDTGTAVQMSGSLVSVGCGSPLRGNIETKEEKDDPRYGIMAPELDTGTVVQMSGSLGSVGCGSPLPGNTQIQEEYDPHHGNMKPEPDTEEKHHDVKTKSNTEEVQHLVPDMATGLLGYMPVVVFPNFGGPQAGLQNQCLQYYIMAGPQGPTIRPDTVSNITPRLNTEGAQYIFPVQAVGCPMVTIDPGNESTLIRREQENVPADLQQGEVHRK